MSFPTRMIVTFVNIFSLIVTLAYPNSATPVSVLPIAIGVSTWAFVYYNEYTDKGKKEARNVIWLTVVLSLFCFFLFVTCEFEGTVFKFKEDVIYLRGKTIEYWLFAVPISIAIIGLTVAEFSALKYGKIKRAKSFDQYVCEAVYEG